MHDDAELMARYQQVRIISKRINDALIRTLARDVLEEGGRKLGILRNGTLVFRSEDETSVLMDYCLYNIRRDGMNTVQRHLAESPLAEGSDELLLLQAKARARYSLFLVEKVIPNVGVELLDVFRDDRVFVVDLGFSKTASRGVGLATRLISLGDFWMTGGASLQVTAESLVLLKRRLQALLGSGDPDWHNLPTELEDEFVAVVAGACLESHVGPALRLEEPAPPAGRFAVTQPSRRAVHIGRNDPCPCGSGRKYKKCCGR
jgi:hypothetical protein